MESPSGALAPVAEQIPLRVDAHGTIRIGNSRVTLETLVNVYRQGATAEQLAEEFPTLHLADIYAVLSYYLRHRATVDEYLRQQDREAEEVRRQFESMFEDPKLRDRLAAMRGRKRNSDA